MKQETKSWQVLDSFSLKIIAVIFMTIDHIGYFLFPNVEIWRIIGRLAFPIFAYLCAEAFRYTRDKTAYARRMLAFGAIITFVKMMAEPYLDFEADIFITLGLGFLILWALQDNKILWAIGIFLFGMLINTEYGWYGLVLVPFMYYFRHREILILPALTLLSWLYVISSYPMAQLTMNFWFTYPRIADTQIWAGLAGIPLCLYNGESGCRKYKYWFYAYYPIHIVLLYFLSMAIYA